MIQVSLILDLDLGPVPRKKWQLLVRKDGVEPKSRPLFPRPSYLGVAMEYKKHKDRPLMGSLELGVFLPIHLDTSAKVSQAMGRSQSSKVISLPEMTRRH